MPKICCSRHLKEVEATREGFIQRQILANRDDLAISLAASDKDKTGRVSRDVLRIVGQLQLAKHQYSLPGPDMEALLDCCVVSAEQQRKLQEWGREKERRAYPLGYLPAALYDSRLFAEDLIARMEALDRERYL